MLFTELRASIVARLRRAMPKEVRVLPHPGPLDEEELARICFGDPSLLAAVSAGMAPFPGPQAT